MLTVHLERTPLPKMDRVFKSCGITIAVMLNAAQHYLMAASVVLLVVLVIYCMIKLYAYTKIRDNNPVKNLEKSYIFQGLLFFMGFFLFMIMYKFGKVAWRETDDRVKRVQERPKESCTPAFVSTALKTPLKNQLSFEQQEEHKDCLRSWIQIFWLEFLKVQLVESVNFDTFQIVVFQTLVGGVIWMLSYELYQWQKRKTADVQSQKMVQSRNRLEAYKGDDSIGNLEAYKAVCKRIQAGLGFGEKNKMNVNNFLNKK